MIYVLGLGKAFAMVGSLRGYKTTFSFNVENLFRSSLMLLKKAGVFVRCKLFQACLQLRISLELTPFKRQATGLTRKCQTTSKNVRDKFCSRSFKHCPPLSMFKKIFVAPTALKNVLQSLEQIFQSIMSDGLTFVAIQSVVTEKS